MINVLITFLAVTKYPSSSNLQEEGFISSYNLKGYSALSPSVAWELFKEAGA